MSEQQFLTSPDAGGYSPLERLKSHLVGNTASGKVLVPRDVLNALIACFDVSLAAAPVPCAAQSEAEPPVLKSAWVGDGTKLAARFYDYGAYEQWLRGHVCANRPEPSVPLSAIRALVQQWREEAQKARSYGSVPQLERSKTLRGCATDLTALCPAPPEDEV